MAIYDDFKNIAPAYESLDQAYVDNFIGYAQDQVSHDVFGNSYNLAVAYLTAHMIALAQRNAIDGINGLSGAASSKREGDLAISYNSPQMNYLDPDKELLTTSYGIEFLRLRKKFVIMPRTFYDSN